MRIAIALAAITPPAVHATCWVVCDCGTECTALAAAAWMGLALATGAAIFVVASMAWELYLLSCHRPPVFRADGFD